MHRDDRAVDGHGLRGLGRQHRQPRGESLTERHVRLTVAVDVRLHLGRRCVHARVDDAPAAEHDREHERGDDDPHPVRGEALAQRRPRRLPPLGSRTPPRATSRPRRRPARLRPGGRAGPGPRRSRRSRPVRPAPSWAAAVPGRGSGGRRSAAVRAGSVSTGTLGAGGLTVDDFGAAGFGAVERRVRSGAAGPGTCGNAIFQRRVAALARIPGVRNQISTVVTCPHGPGIDRSAARPKVEFPPAGQDRSRSGTGPVRTPGEMRRPRRRGASPRAEVGVEHPRPLQVEVHVDLPREAHAAVHLRRRLAVRDRGLAREHLGAATTARSSRRARPASSRCAPAA